MGIKTANRHRSKYKDLIEFHKTVPPLPPKSLPRSPETLTDLSYGPTHALTVAKPPTAPTTRVTGLNVLLNTHTDESFETPSWDVTKQHQDIYNLFCQTVYPLTLSYASVFTITFVIQYP